MRQRILVKVVECLTETGLLLELGECVVRGDESNRFNVGSLLNEIRQAICVAFAHIRLQVNRKVERVVPTGADRLRVLDDKVQRRRNGERHGNNEDIIRLANGCRNRRPSEPIDVLTWRVSQVAKAPEERTGATASECRVTAMTLAPRLRRGTSLPSSSAIRRQPIRSISEMSWLAINSVTPTSLKRRKIRMTSKDKSGSRLPVGSSAISSFGRVTIARAMPTRCCSPADSVSGFCVPCAAGRPGRAPRARGGQHHGG